MRCGFFGGTGCLVRYRRVRALGNCYSGTAGGVRPFSAGVSTRFRGDGLRWWWPSLALVCLLSTSYAVRSAMESAKLETVEPDTLIHDDATLSSKNRENQTDPVQGDLFRDMSHDILKEMNLLMKLYKGLDQSQLDHTNTNDNNDFDTLLAKIDRNLHNVEQVYAPRVYIDQQNTKKKPLRHSIRSQDNFQEDNTQVIIKIKESLQKNDTTIPTKALVETSHNLNERSMTTTNADIDNKNTKPFVGEDDVVSTEERTGPLVKQPIPEEKSILDPSSHLDKPFDQKESLTEKENENLCQLSKELNEGAYIQPDESEIILTTTPTANQNEEPSNSLIENVELENTDLNFGMDPQDLSNQGLYNPNTGEVNWDCPTLAGLAHGPCGFKFRSTFLCFLYSDNIPKGKECLQQFDLMQKCFHQNSDYYFSKDDDL